MTHKLRPLFTFSFGSTELAPAMDFQRLLVNDSVLRDFFQQSLLSESLMRRQRNEEQVSIMAQAAGEASTKNKTEQSTQESGKTSETGTTKTYVITYYNPETHKAEVLETKSDIKIQDNVKQMIEESLGMQSIYPLYTFIGLPLMKQEILPWKLEGILAEREYGTPPPFGSGAPVVPVKKVEQTEAEIVAIKKQEEAIKEAVVETIILKERSELKIDEEIIMLGETVEALRKGEEIDKVLDKLPPLSRARYIVALRKKQLGRQIIIRLLLKDASFLKTVKKKLETFTFEDLINMVKLLRDMQKKK